MHLSLFLISAIFFPIPAASWGNIGHRTVGYLAEKYPNPQATELFNGIINPSDAFDISDAVIWADSHRQREWAYTYNWHFIDGRDDPPDECSVKFERDCDFCDNCVSHRDPSCVVSAIANMLLSSISTPVTRPPMPSKCANEASIRLRGETDFHLEDFHSHKNGDYGNRISGELEELNSAHHTPGCPPRKKCINLHADWASLMIEELLQYQATYGKDEIVQAEKTAARKWAKDLFSDAPENSDLDEGDCIPTGESPDDAITCALKWASESNNFICSYVLKDGVAAVNNQELSGAYYQGAVPIIKAQIGRSARRFAATLNAMAASNTGRKHLDDGQMVIEEL